MNQVALTQNQLETGAMMLPPCVSQCPSNCLESRILMRLLRTLKRGGQIGLVASEMFKSMPNFQASQTDPPPVAEVPKVVQQPIQQKLSTATPPILHRKRPLSASANVSTSIPQSKPTTTIGQYLKQTTTKTPLSTSLNQSKLATKLTENPVASTSMPKFTETAARIRALRDVLPVPPTLSTSGVVTRQLTGVRLPSSSSERELPEVANKNNSASKQVTPAAKKSSQSSNDPRKSRESSIVTRSQVLKPSNTTNNQTTPTLVINNSSANTSLSSSIPCKRPRLDNTLSLEAVKTGTPEKMFQDSLEMQRKFVHIETSFHFFISNFGQVYCASQPKPDINLPQLPTSLKLSSMQSDLNLVLIRFAFIPHTDMYSYVVHYASLVPKSLSCQLVIYNNQKQSWDFSKCDDVTSSSPFARGRIDLNAVQNELYFAVVCDHGAGQKMVTPIIVVDPSNFNARYKITFANDVITIDD